MTKLVDQEWKNDITPGPWGCPLEPGGGSPRGSRLPELHQDQHVLLGKDPQTQLQEEEVLDKTPSRGICKYHQKLQTKILFHFKNKK